MAELFDKVRSTITEHINNIIKEGEVDEKSTVGNSDIANSDKPVKIYNLDMIIAVGYRVKSNSGTEFRKWATERLKEYIIQGFSINDEFLKNNGGGKYW
ncbi:MAG: RhuM family protein [Clostridia bacterium]